MRHEPQNQTHSFHSFARAATAATFAALALTVGGGAIAQATTPVTTPDTTPATTPDTTPATLVTTPDTVAPANGGDGIDWFPIVLVVVLGVVLISIVVALMSRRKPAAAAPAARPVTPTASPQSEIMSTAQWVHDQLSLEILAAAPAAGLQRWTVERSRLDNVAIRANQQFTEGHGEAWQRLGQSMSQLGGALDTTLQLRNQDTPDAQLIQESTDVVTRRRGELQMLLTAIWPSVQR